MFFFVLASANIQRAGAWEILQDSPVVMVFHKHLRSVIAARYLAHSTVRKDPSMVLIGELEELKGQPILALRARSNGKAYIIVSPAFNAESLILEEPVRYWLLILAELAEGGRRSLQRSRVGSKQAAPSFWPLRPPELLELRPKTFCSSRSPLLSLKSAGKLQGR